MQKTKQEKYLNQIQKTKELKQEAWQELIRLLDIKQKAKQHLRSIKGFYLHVFFAPILKLSILYNITIVNSGIRMAKLDHIYYSSKLKKLQQLLQSDERRCKQCGVGENLPDGSGGTVWANEKLCSGCFEEKEKEKLITSP
ncbi:MAG: hypothetical protein PHC46_04510 [Clostridia bacterium]|nr:hypothetical protein [Clostridia bacterium]